MSRTNWQDPKTDEIISPHIAGLQEAVGKIEESIEMETITETNIPLTEVYISSDDRYRIYQAPEGKKNWVLSSAPVIYQNGVIMAEGFEIDYGGGAIILNSNGIESNVFTADATFTKKTYITNIKSSRFVIGTSTSGWTSKDCDYLCDGTSDDVEINNAIQNLPAGGGEIVILNGTYNITAKISANKNNVSILGNGNSTILKRMWDSSGIPEGVITLTGVNGCKIEKLCIDGNRANFYSFINNGILIIENGNENIITNNTSNDNIKGICLYSSNNNTIINNTCNNNYDKGIYSDTSSNNTIISNICNNNNIGISLQSSKNNTITGNTCIRGTGLISDYSVSQYTIQLNGTANSYNLISNNNCMGKAIVNGGGTGNSIFNNKWNESDDIQDIRESINNLDAEVDEHKAEGVSYFTAASRDLTIEGIQTIAGFPFTPKTILINTVVTGTEKICFGMYAENQQDCIFKRGNSLIFVPQGMASIEISDTNTDRTRGIIAVSGSEITITWSKIGNGATGTASLRITALSHGGV